MFGSRDSGTVNPRSLHNAARVFFPAVRALFNSLFSIDLRSLAVFRIVIAGIVLVDLLSRAQFIEANYTAAGVMPLRFLPPMDRYLSLHAISGHYTFQVLLFLIAACSALLMLVGYRTRLFTLLTWLLTVSLHCRNTALLDGADTLHASLMLWGIFLPLGARWSIDARRGRSRNVTGSAVLSSASVTLLLQFMFYYVTTGLAKSGDDWHVTGKAVEMALSQDYWVRPFGAYVRQYPELLRVLTPTVVCFERIAPFLLFVPIYTGRVRMVVIAFFWLFVLGLGSAIQLNLMPWISTAATLPFLPSSFWDFLLKRGTATGVSRGPGMKAIISSPRRNAKLYVAEQVLVVVLMVYVAATIPLPIGSSHTSKMQDAASRLGLNLVWVMYAPPPSTDLAQDVVATLEDGSVVHLLAAESEDHWKHILRIHRSYRFKCYMESSMHYPAKARQHLSWLAREWESHREHPRLLVNLKVYVDVSQILSPNASHRYLMAELTENDLPELRMQYH